MVRVADWQRGVGGPVVAEAAGQLFGEVHRVAHRAAVAACVGATAGGERIGEQLARAGDRRQRRLVAIEPLEARGGFRQRGADGGNVAHFAASISLTKWSNRSPMSCGPGLASGWPWKQKAGASVSAKP